MRHRELSWSHRTTRYSRLGRVGPDLGDKSLQRQMPWFEDRRQNDYCFRRGNWIGNSPGVDKGIHRLSCLPKRYPQQSRQARALDPRHSAAYSITRSDGSLVIRIIRHRLPLSSVRVHASMRPPPRKKSASPRVPREVTFSGPIRAVRAWRYPAISGGGVPSGRERSNTIPPWKPTTSRIFGELRDRNVLTRPNIEELRFGISLHQEHAGIGQIVENRNSLLG